eukprot:gene4111-4801_t
MFEYISSSSLLTDIRFDSSEVTAAKRVDMAKDIVVHVNRGLCPMKQITSLTYLSKFLHRLQLPAPLLDSGMLANLRTLRLHDLCALEVLLKLPLLTKLSIASVYNMDNFDLPQIIGRVHLTSLSIDSTCSESDVILKYIQQQTTLTSLGAISYSPPFNEKLEAILWTKPSITKLTTGHFLSKLPSNITSIAVSGPLKSDTPLSRIIANSPSIRHLTISQPSQLKFSLFSSITSLVTVRFSIPPKMPIATKEIKDRLERIIQSPSITTIIVYTEHRIDSLPDNLQLVSELYNRKDHKLPIITKIYKKIELNE